MLAVVAPKFLTFDAHLTPRCTGVGSSAFQGNERYVQPADHAERKHQPSKNPVIGKQFAHPLHSLQRQPLAESFHGS